MTDEFPASPPPAATAPSTWSGPAAHPAAADHLSTLRLGQSWVRNLLGGADPSAPVPWCGTWQVADVALHLGTVHLWAAAMMRGVDIGVHDPAAPRDRESLVDFYDFAANILWDSCVSLDADRRALTLDGPGPPGYWWRRQANETLIHAADIARSLAADETLNQVSAEQWDDVTDEVVSSLAPRQVRLQRLAPPATAIAFQSTDTAARWVWGPGDPVAKVSGPSKDVALTLWGRTSPWFAAPEIEGDEDAARRALASKLTP
ncbi:maleylpyruvate isomerase family mycothiol-dependent enzyme [Rarobacter incanus]|uniref:Uncharacterized protein (TIGR03083 family) n=1 Tax=Rarobacter incanus TaxID=153494 RepID=A0A542SMU4_9MICO|nr:maleylpyruvate isomerase family mycothiol-dependent enzyme [Rarobacter incanus]TQK75950.1 uncharacterized protein (TIGR03083 family) [Rarobacter incanus]